MHICIIHYLIIYTPWLVFHIHGSFEIISQTSELERTGLIIIAHMKNVTVILTGSLFQSLRIQHLCNLHDCKLSQSLWRRVGKFMKKSEIEVSYLSNPHISIELKGIKWIPRIDTWAPTCIIELLTTIEIIEKMEVSIEKWMDKENMIAT